MEDTTGSLRAQLNRLAVMLGKSPAGHAIAYERWIELATDCHRDRGELRPFRRVNSTQGRVGFLAMAEDALDRDDINDFQDVCIGAALWEAERLKV